MTSVGAIVLAGGRASRLGGVDKARVAVAGRPMIESVVGAARAVAMDGVIDALADAALADAVNVPVIASGGVGNLDHLVDGVLKGGADAVLAASIFHFGEHTIPEAKRYMAERGIEMRL